METGKRRFISLPPSRSWTSWGQYLSPLQVATHFGEREVLDLMLELGFDPAAVRQAGGTALHCAAWKGSAAAVRAILRHPRASEILEVRDPSFNSTPLGWCCHGAANSGHRGADYPGVARLLLDGGAEPVHDSEAIPEAVREVPRRYRSSAEPGV